MKVYIDINDFTKDGSITSFLKSYDAFNKKIEFYIKADGSKYPELEDYKKVRRRNKFESDDLKTINFFLYTYDTFESFKFQKDDIILRLYDDSSSSLQKLYLFYDKDDNEEDIKRKINESIDFFNTYIENEESKEIKLGLVEKYNDDDNLTYKFIKNEIKEFNEIIALKNVMDNKNDIVLLDNELTFYIFTLLSYYSKFKKKEKSVKGYFSSFKPFGYQKYVESEVNLNSAFNYSTFVIKKDGTINLYVSKDIAPSELISLFNRIEDFNEVIIEE